MKCTFCPNEATMTTLAGHPICDECAEVVPVLMGKDEKVEKVTDVILKTLDPKKT